MSLIWKKYRMPYQRHPQQVPFRDWRVGDFAVWDNKLRGTHAAIDMLLPFAAVAIGLTGFWTNLIYGLIIVASVAMHTVLRRRMK